MGATDVFSSPPFLLLSLKMLEHEEWTRCDEGRSRHGSSMTVVYDEDDKTCDVDHEQRRMVQMGVRCVRRATSARSCGFVHEAHRSDKKE